MTQHRLAVAIVLLALLAATAYVAFGGGAETPQRDALHAVEADRVPTADAPLEVTRNDEHGVPAREAPTAAAAPATSALRMLALDSTGQPLPKARIAAYER